MKSTTCVIQEKEPTTVRGHPTTHISPHLYGTGVKPGIDYSRHYITDIAPTVAALLGIQMPNGCVGEAISLE